MIEAMEGLVNLLGIMGKTDNRPFQLWVELGGEAPADVGACEKSACVHVGRPLIPYLLDTF